jgi:hypothetical protein
MQKTPAWDGPSRRPKACGGCDSGTQTVPGVYCPKSLTIPEAKARRKRQGNPTLQGNPALLDCTQWASHAADGATVKTPPRYRNGNILCELAEFASRHAGSVARSSLHYPYRWSLRKGIQSPANTGSPAVRESEQCHTPGLVSLERGKVSLRTGLTRAIPSRRVDGRWLGSIAKSKLSGMQGTILCNRGRRGRGQRGMSWSSRTGC